MSTDRELLEAAAKAAGMAILPDGQWPNDATGWFYNEHGGNGGGLFYVGHKVPDSRWNPLTDDGDALRLAVKLKIVPQHAALYVVAIQLTDALEIACHEDYGDAPYAATRRAIVRAAASMAPQEKAE